MPLYKTALVTELWLPPKILVTKDRNILIDYYIWFTDCGFEIRLENSGGVTERSKLSLYCTVCGREIHIKFLLREQNSRNHSYQKPGSRMDLK